MIGAQPFRAAVALAQKSLLKRELAHPQRTAIPIHKQALFFFSLTLGSELRLCSLGPLCLPRTLHKMQKLETGTQPTMNSRLPPQGL